MLFGSVFLTVNVTAMEGEGTLLPPCSEGLLMTQKIVIPCVMVRHHKKSQVQTGCICKVVSRYHYDLRDHISECELHHLIGAWCNQCGRDSSTCEAAMSAASCLRCGDLFYRFLLLRCSASSQVKRQWSLQTIG